MIDRIQFAKDYLGLELPDHQREWIQFFHSAPWVLLLGPRGHGKSTALYVDSVASICEDPDLRVLIASHKEEMADTFARQIQIALEDERIQADFGLVKGKPWRIGKCFFEGHRHPVIKTVAKLAGITGNRFDMVIADDLLTAENVQTEKLREQIESWLWGEVFPTLDPSPKQRIVITGTRKHLEDWYSKLLMTEDFKCRVDKIWIGEGKDRKYLWPERFTPEECRKLQKNWPPDKFAQEFMNDPVAMGGLRFKREWLKFYDELPEQRYLHYFMGIDPSMGSVKERASYMAIAVVAVDEREPEKIYVVYLQRGKLALSEQQDIITSVYNRFQPDRCNIEAVLANIAFADSVLDQFPQFTEIDYVHTGLKGTSDVSKIGRIENIIGMLFKQGRICLPQPTNPVIKTFIEAEYVQFPDGDMDQLDALNMAVDGIDYIEPLDHLPVRAF